MLHIFLTTIIADMVIHPRHRYGLRDIHRHFHISSVLVIAVFVYRHRSHRLHYKHRFRYYRTILDQLYKPAMVIHTIITTIHHHHPHNQRKHGRLVLTLHLVFINSPDKADSVLDKLLGRSLTCEREAVIRNELHHPP